MNQNATSSKKLYRRTIHQTYQELHKAITQLKSEKEVDHEHNILNMTQVDDYKSLWKYKDTTLVNNSAYTFIN